MQLRRKSWHARLFLTLGNTGLPMTVCGYVLEFVLSLAAVSTLLAGLSVLVVFAVLYPLELGLFLGGLAALLIAVYLFFVLVYWGPVFRPLGGRKTNLHNY